MSHRGGHPRRELRRPNMNDIQHQMAGVNLGDGGNMYGAPQPAPNADGWSSGVNHFDHSEMFNHGQQQMGYNTQGNGGMDGGRGGGNGHFNQYYQPMYDEQQQFYNNQQQYHYQPQQDFGGYASGMNAGASEFVPKSSLSVSANEFVPRNMATNTSAAWAPVSGPPASQSRGGNSSYSSSGSSGYDPVQRMEDAIGTLELRPAKFDLAAQGLTRSYKTTLSDLATTQAVIQCLLNKSLTASSFRQIGARLFIHLSKTLESKIEGTTFTSVLLEQCQASVGNIKGGANDEQFRNFAVVLSHVFANLDEDESVLKLTEPVMELLEALSKPPRDADLDNLKALGISLEESGARLESDLGSKNQKSRLDDLMSTLANITKKLKEEESSKKDESRCQVVDILSGLPERRETGWPKRETPLEPEKPKKSLVTLEAPPEEPKAPKSTSNSSKPPSRSTSGSGTGADLTEEELRFMAEQMGDYDNSSESSDAYNDPEMTQEIQDAYEAFLSAQQ